MYFTLLSFHQHQVHHQQFNHLYSYNHHGQQHPQHLSPQQQQALPLPGIETFTSNGNPIIPLPPQDTTPPLGHTTVPLGQATSPLGHGTSPLGHITSPLGHATSPLGQNTIPLGHTASPTNHTPSPIGHPTIPIGQTPSPIGNTSAPIGHAISPMGHATSPPLPISPVAPSLGNNLLNNSNSSAYAAQHLLEGLQPIRTEEIIRLRNDGGGIAIVETSMAPFMGESQKANS